MFRLSRVQLVTVVLIATGVAVAQSAVTGAIVGIRSAHQANGIAGAADVKLSAGDMLGIEQALTRQAA